MAALLRQEGEMKWSETQILEPSPCEMDELPKLARQYFKMFGLRDVYDGVSEEPKEDRIFQDKIPEEACRPYLTSFLGAVSPEETDKAYLTAITGAAVGNPLAAEQFSAVRETLLNRVAEEDRESYSEKLLESGLVAWNKQKAEFPTRSYHQIEQMTDVLCAMIADNR